MGGELEEPCLVTTIPPSPCLRPFAIGSTARGCLVCKFLLRTPIAIVVLVPCTKDASTSLSHPSHRTRARHDPVDTFRVIWSTSIQPSFAPSVKQKTLWMIVFEGVSGTAPGVCLSMGVRVYLIVCGTTGPYRRRVESTSDMAVASASSCGIWRNRVSSKAFGERPRRVRVRAGPEGREPREGSFAEDLFENLKDEVATSMSFMDPEQYVTRDPQTKREFQKSGQESRDQVRRAEKRILDFATSESFTKAGLFSVGTILFFYLAVVGAPPSDGKCTLPWC